MHYMDTRPLRKFHGGQSAKQWCDRVKLLFNEVPRRSEKQKLREKGSIVKGEEKRALKVAKAVAKTVAGIIGGEKSPPLATLKCHPGLQKSCCGCYWEHKHREILHTVAEEEVKDQVGHGKWRRIGKRCGKEC